MVNKNMTNQIFRGLKAFGGIQNVELAQGGTDVNTFDLWVKDSSRVKLTESGLDFCKVSGRRFVVRAGDMNWAIRFAEVINEMVEDFNKNSSL